MDTERVKELVDSAVKKLGEPKGRREFNKYEKELGEAIKELWKLGYNCTEIGSALKTKRHAIGSFLKKEGLYKPQNYKTTNGRLAAAREVNPY